MEITQIDNSHYPVASQQPLDRGNLNIEPESCNKELTLSSPCQGGGSVADGGYVVDFKANDEMRANTVV
jgi:hypothetical protein